MPDDESGQRDPARRVIAAGYKRIAYPTLASALMATKSRMVGHRATLNEVGIDHDPV